MRALDGWIGTALSPFRSSHGRAPDEYFDKQCREAM